MTRRRGPNRQPRGPRATLPLRSLGPVWPPCGNDREHAPDLCLCWHDRKECPGIPEVHWAYTCPFNTTEEQQ